MMHGVVAYTCFGYGASKQMAWRRLLTSEFTQ